MEVFHIEDRSEEVFGVRDVDLTLAEERFGHLISRRFLISLILYSRPTGTDAVSAENPGKGN